MLEEHEWEQVAEALRAGLQGLKKERKEKGISLSAVDTASYYREALERYERLTGYRETNPRALYHHRVSLYGPPCPHCGKPLRTPKAKLCAACGTRR